MTRIWNKHKQTNTPLKRKVFVALSGGVDSSVSLYLLKKAGYDCTAVFIKIGECADTVEGENVNADSCWIGERREAMRVAAYLDVPFKTFDFDKEYKKEVLDYFFREYKTGRTPNPDVMCNRKIKFPLFWKKTKAMGADFMATGHYARIAHGNSGNPKSQIPNPKKYKLFAGKDKNKDQSYFLYNLKQKDLEHILFPIGDLTKKEVRAIAREAGLPNANKKDSQGLCFLGQINVKKFLQTKIKPQKGDIVIVNGKKIGRHEGLAYYTIGQRHGLGSLVAKEPLFVVDKNFKKNILIVAPEKDEKKFYKKEAIVTDVNFLVGTGLGLSKPLRCSARIRYRAPLEKCVVSIFPPARVVLPLAKGESGGVGVMGGERKAKVIFFKPLRAVTPGQSIVFYKGDQVLGGGIIQ